MPSKKKVLKKTKRRASRKSKNKRRKKMLRKVHKGGAAAAPLTPVSQLPLSEKIARGEMSIQEAAIAQNYEGQLGNLGPSPPGRVVRTPQGRTLGSYGLPPPLPTQQKVPIILNQPKPNVTVIQPPPPGTSGVSPDAFKTVQQQLTNTKRQLKETSRAASAAQAAAQQELQNTRQQLDQTLQDRNVKQQQLDQTVAQLQNSLEQSLQKDSQIAALSDQTALKDQQLAAAQQQLLTTATTHQSVLDSLKQLVAQSEGSLKMVGGLGAYGASPQT